MWANREAARRANTAFRVNMVQINGVDFAKEEDGEKHRKTH